MASVSRRTDERMMRRALALAVLGVGTAAPNPKVGAVVARGGRVLGQGFHRRPGEAHAESVALDDLRRTGASPRGATLYTTLEPCCHFGRTPPCVDRILSAGIARVVASMRDPNPKVDGGGFRALRRHGVAVEVGLLREEALRLNEGFVKHIRTGLPLVTLKGAVTLDGRIATSSGDSKWITSASARRHARLLRYEHEALIVGIGTVLADDPRLDRRPPLPGSGALLRVILDGRLRLPTSSRLVKGLARGPVLAFCGPRALAARRRELERAGVEVLRVPASEGRLDLRAVLAKLGERAITSVLVEGGGEVLGSFLDAGLADRLALYVAPKLLGGADARPLFAGKGAARIQESVPLRRVRWTRLSDDFYVEGRLFYR